MNSPPSLLSVSQRGGVSNAQKKPFKNQKNNRIEKIINSQWTFNYFPDEAKERALKFISKMNPYVKVSNNSEQSPENDKKNVANVSYTAENGQPILLPALKFISE